MQVLTTMNDQFNLKFLGGLSVFGLNQSWSIFFMVVCALALISILSLASYHAGRFTLIKSAQKISSHSSLLWVKLATEHKVFHRISLLLPGMIVYASGMIVDSKTVWLFSKISSFLHLISTSYLLAVTAMILFSVLDTLEGYSRKYNHVKIRPIKSYLQILKLITFIFITLLIISTLLNKSPAYLLTGIGAMTAVVMLVFKDSILGFVASIQLAAYDMVRMGDWIELPQYGANGDVVDISLNTVKVQNFDKTIVTIPSYALLTNGVVNWRGMTESGGRRIKRAININVHSVKFDDENLLNKLGTIQLLKPLIEKKLAEIVQYNEEHKVNTSLKVNGRALTNLGLFRNYIELYLKKHPKIHQELTFLIRQLEVAGKGIPIELYVFTNDTNWAHYEGIQADIFDHLYAIAPYFELNVFQYMSGQDLNIKLDRNTGAALGV